MYVQEECPYCKQIAEELKKNDIKFEKKVIKDDQEEWYAVVDLTGVPTTPTILHEDNYFVPGRDFNTPTDLIQIIKYFKKSGFNYNRRSLERIKTLNYNINIAFNRLDGVLRNIEMKLNKEEENVNKSNS